MGEDTCGATLKKNRHNVYKGQLQSVDELVHLALALRAVALGVEVIVEVDVEAT